MANEEFDSKIIAKLASNVDWSFGDANTKQITHEIHRYSGKYIPQIARQAIELISSPGDLVLDPYVGSGTTLLEANLIGRRSLGIDLNPLAVLIAGVKIKPIKEKELLNLLEYFRKISDQLTTARMGQVSLLEDRSVEIKNIIQKDSRTSDPWYTKWFTEPVLRDLVVLDNLIDAYPVKECSNLARIAFSNILRRCSNAHSGYPNVMLDKKKNNKTQPGPLFIKCLSESIEKIKDLNKTYNPDIETKVIQGNATSLPLKDSTVDAVVTHPPYIGSVPYAEYGLLSLKWLGHDPQAIDGELTGGKRQSKNVIERFLVDYEAMLAEAYRVLKKGRSLFILIGDPTVRGEIVDLAKTTKDLSTKVGFRLVVEKKRNGINRRANKMGPETALFFQK